MTGEAASWLAVAGQLYGFVTRAYQLHACTEPIVPVSRRALPCYW
jgi:hypothetical protein